MDSWCEACYDYLDSVDAFELSKLLSEHSIQGYLTTRRKKRNAKLREEKNVE